MVQTDHSEAASKCPTNAQEQELKREVLAHMPTNTVHEQWMNRYMPPTARRPSIGRPPGYKPGDWYRVKMAELAAKHARIEAAKKQCITLTPFAPISRNPNT
ncbi:hypothetical protein B0H10DRAFT_1951633 [Mycena sp. CBHHK59/15]|nr:hypothetical protein B0H10DRAFT_1951633 [Mycena sp. CBHHK59/15]